MHAFFLVPQHIAMENGKITVLGSNVPKKNSGI
jgi:hypothetical protein